jgi:lipoyl synthase
MSVSLPLKKKIRFNPGSLAMTSFLAGCRLQTVCTAAHCPNKHECFARGVATFLILGEFCTRACTFCAVKKGKPEPPDPDEPRRIALALQQQKISHAVITSVTRDDLPDGGAGQFVRVINELRRRLPSCTIEVLIPDLAGNKQAWQAIFQARPDVLNHNMETVPQLYPVVRPQADYQRSLAILAAAKTFDSALITKSGIMVGLGETKEMVMELMQDLRRADCDILTIGQYFQPQKKSLPVLRHVTEEEFNEYAAYGKQSGFRQVVAGRFVRSSYRAGELYQLVKSKAHLKKKN